MSQTRRESDGEARVNVDFREEEQAECVSLPQCKNCEQAEDEKAMLREERETHRKIKNNRNMARRGPKTQLESRRYGPKKKGEGTQELKTHQQR